MRIAVFSDTHGCRQQMRLALEQMGPVDFILHAGDYFADGASLAELAGVDASAVTGNCDYQVGGPTERVLELGGRRILLTHGHLYRVKQGYQRLLERGRQAGVQTIVFGHTHHSELSWEDGILLFNPGSLYRPVGEEDASYGLLDIAGGKIEPQIKHLRYY